MRIYKVTAQTGADSYATMWAGSMAEVRQHAKTIMEKHGVKRSQVKDEEVDVPSGKAGLLGFLNGL